MQRKEFIKTCSFACLGAATASFLLESCAGSRLVNAVLNGDVLEFEASVFKTTKKGKVIYRSYVIVHHNDLKYPIYVYRESAEKFTALHMECSHQGAELTSFGDILQCSAHGSEFTHTGSVQTGPATEALRQFPVKQIDQKISISLKKI